jgi:HPt (histidine-containing phosphotransfer) domain-containing protein
MTLREIRQAYDKNYWEMLRIIDQMGGELNIQIHRTKRSALYLKLRKLQRREHQLDRLESQMIYRQISRHREVSAI